MSRIKVLHVIQSLQYGGMERLIAGMVHKLNGPTAETKVLVLEYVGRFGEGLPDNTVIQAPPQPRTSLLYPGTLAKTLRELGPHIVHSHSGVWYKAARAARLAGVKGVVHTDHGRPSPDPFVARAIDHLGSRLTDVTVGVSQSVADLLRRRVAGPRADVRVILNGIDTDVFHPSRLSKGALHAELGLAPGTSVIGSIGRLQPVKGYEVMIDAFRAFTQRHGARNDVHLVIAGDGSERSALQGRIEQFSLGDRVHLLGWRDDLHNLLGGSTIFSMSSHSEGTSVSLLEAMSCQRCPVVTDVGGNAAVLGDRLRHRLVPPRDPEALAAAWARALDDLDARERDAVASRERVVQTYSADAMCRSYERVYMELAGISPQKRAGAPLVDVA